jgi:hypothetical protein
MSASLLLNAPAMQNDWGGVPLVHEVDEWRNGLALIPAEWMN